MDTQVDDGILEQFRTDFLRVWHQLPYKGAFFALLAAWCALFHFLGNSALGYIASNSLFQWMFEAYTAGGHDLGAEDAYGLMVPFVVLALMWWKRKDLLSSELKPWAPSLLIVAVGLFLHLLGYSIQQQRISIVGLFIGIYGLTGLAWGFGWLRASFFPFFLFAFCVPLGSLAEPITFRLRLMVSQLVEIVCHYGLAINVIREGTSISDPTGSYKYEIAAACSGIRSLMSIFGFAVVLAFVSLRTWWGRGFMIAASVPLAVIGNLVRMLCIVIAAEFFGASAGSKVHDDAYFSLLPYVPPFIGLLWLERFLGDREPKKPDPRKTLSGLDAPAPVETKLAVTE